MYGLGAALVDRKTGLFAAALVVFSPGIISNSATMTHNITVTFFTLLTVLVATRYAQKPTTRGFVLMSIMAGLGVSVKFSALPAMAVIPVAVLAVDRLRPVTSRLMKMAAGGLLSIFAFVVTSPYYLPGMFEGSQGYGGMKSTDVFSIATNWESSGGLLHIILSLPGRLTGILVSELGLLQGLLAVVGLAGLFVLGRRRPHFLPYLSVLVAFVVMFMFVDPYYIKRVRILPFFPFIILAAGYGLVRLQEVLKPSRGTMFGLLALLFVWQGLLVASVMAAYRAPEVQDVSNEWMLENIDQSSSIGMLDPPGWRYPSYLSYDASLLDGEHPKESRLTTYRFVVLSTPDSLVDARPDWIILRRPWPSEFTATGRDSLYELVREFEIDAPRFERPLSLVWNPYLLFETHLYFLRRNSVLD